MEGFIEDAKMHSHEVAALAKQIEMHQKMLIQSLVVQAESIQKVQRPNPHSYDPNLTGYDPALLEDDLFETIAAYLEIFKDWLGKSQRDQICNGITVVSLGSVSVVIITYITWGFLITNLFPIIFILYVYQKMCNRRGEPTFSIKIDARR